MNPNTYLDNKKNEVSKIINKFLELKSLVLEYKKDKDDQINNLNDQLNFELEH